MPNGTYSANNYRYGFNGKESDPEISGNGNQYDYGFRIYNPRIGRFLSVDPLTKDYPWYAPYQFSGNKPTRFIDLDGAEEHDPMKWEDEQYLSDKMSKEEISERRKARGLGAIIVGALVADIYFFHGKATETVLKIYSASQIAGEFEHNQATTPEGKVEQDQRSKTALAEGAVGLGMSKIVSVFAKITLGAGKVVYKTFQSSSIRFSQSSIKGSSYEAVKALIKEGEDLGRIDIVKMKDGIYTSLDNKRLMAAQELGKDINAIAHNYDDVLDAATQDRIFDINGVKATTWGEAIEARTKDQAKYISRDSPNGSFVKPQTSKN